MADRTQRAAERAGFPTCLVESSGEDTADHRRVHLATTSRATTATEMAVPPAAIQTTQIQAGTAERRTRRNPAIPELTA